MDINRLKSSQLFIFFFILQQLSEHERDRKRRCRSAREERAELVSSHKILKLLVCSFPRYRATTCSVCRPSQEVAESRSLLLASRERDVVRGLRYQESPGQCDGTVRVIGTVKVFASSTLGMKPMCVRAL